MIENTGDVRILSAQCFHKFFTTSSLCHIYSHLTVQKQQYCVSSRHQRGAIKHLLVEFGRAAQKNTWLSDVLVYATAAFSEILKNSDYDTNRIGVPPVMGHLNVRKKKFRL